MSFGLLQNDDGVILTMDSPSPVSYNNPLYSGPGEDSDNFMVTNTFDVSTIILVRVCSVYTD